MTKTESRLNRLFNIVKTVLMVYPFITLFYLWTTAGQAGTGLSEFMQGNPIITITFITAMLQPFAAWLLTIVQRRIESLDYDAALISVLLIFIAEALMKNMIGLVGLGVLFFYMYKNMPISLKTCFKEGDRRLVLKDATGAVILIGHAAICFFAMTRIGA